jgi:hypothetical protein
MHFLLASVWSVSTYACALPLLQSAILNIDKMVDTLVRLWLQRANDVLSYRLSKVYFLLLVKCHLGWHELHMNVSPPIAALVFSLWVTVHHARVVLIPTSASVWHAVLCNGNISSLHLKERSLKSRRNNSLIVACVHCHLAAFRATCLLLLYGQKPPGVLNFVLTMMIKGRPIIK